MAGDMAQRTQPSSLAAWRARADALAPELADALRACDGLALDESGCGDTLELLGMLGCDAPTQAAAVWFELACADPALWAARSPAVTPDVQRLVAGQLAAGQVWALHAQRAPGGAAEGLRRLLLAIVRDLRVVFVLLARQLAQLRAAASLPRSSGPIPAAKAPRSATLSAV